MLRKYLPLLGLLILVMAMPMSAIAAPAAPVVAPDVAMACMPQQWAWADVPRVDPVIRVAVLRAGTWTVDYAGTWDVWFRNGNQVVHHVSVPVYMNTGQCIWDLDYREIVVPIAAIEGATTVQVHFSRANTHYYDQRWALWELPWAPVGFDPPLAAGWQGLQLNPKEPGKTSPTTIGVWGVAAGKRVWLDDGFTSEHVSRVAWVGDYDTIELKFCVAGPGVCKAVARSVYDVGGVLIGKGTVVQVPMPGASVEVTVK